MGLISDRSPGAARILAAGFGIDVLAIVVFAAVGRRSHDGGSGAGQVVGTSAPFLFALVLGWVAVWVLGRSSERLRDPLGTDGGVAIWAVTVTVGLLARRTLWDRGTALSFVIVTAAFLAATLIGWRSATARWRAQRLPS